VFVFHTTTHRMVVLEEGQRDLFGLKEEGVAVG
jgi:hypothetical protein